MSNAMNPITRKNLRLQKAEALRQQKKNRAVAGILLTLMLSGGATVSPAFADEQAFVQTMPTDGSGIDLSDSSKHYKLANTTGSYIPIEYRRDASYSNKQGLISADKPTALNDLAIATQDSQIVFNPFVNDNAGLQMNERFDYDQKAQDRLIEDDSLQVLNPSTGKPFNLGEALSIDGKATITIIPAKGTADIVPVQTQDGGTAFASNESDRPLVAIDGDRSFIGDISIPYRWKTVSYGESTADLEAFWAQYDADGTGAEFVGEGVIHLKFEAPNLTQGKATGRALAMNPSAPNYTGTNFDPARYSSGATTTGSGNIAPLVSVGSDDSYEIEADAGGGTFAVGDGDETARVSRNFTTAFAGTSDSEAQPVGIKNSNGEVVNNLVIEGEGTWFIQEIFNYTDAEGRSTAVETDNWQRSAHLVFVAEDGYEGASEVTFVNENLSNLPAEGIRVTANNGLASYETAGEHTKLVDSEGNLVDSYDQEGVGTFTVVDGLIRWDKDENFTGSSVSVERSSVDRWVGTEAQQAMDNYDLTVKPYGAEARALLTITLEAPVVIPTPEIPALPEPPIVEIPELPEPPVVEIPELPEPPMVEVPELPEAPPVLVVPEPTPEPTPTPEIPTPETPAPVVPEPVVPEPVTPEPEVGTPEVVEVPEPITPEPETGTPAETVPQIPGVPPVSIPVAPLPDDSSSIADEVIDDSAGTADEVVEQSASTGASFEQILLGAGFSLLFATGFALMVRRNRETVNG